MSVSMGKCLPTCVSENPIFSRCKEDPSWINATCDDCLRELIDPEFKEQRNAIRKKRWRKKYRERRFKELNWRLANSLRSRLNIALKKNIKNTSAVKDLGCSIEEFRQYLESLFKPGMTWENYGNKEGQWSIDHIIPISSFNLSNPEEQKKAVHYTNLQPLWHIENLKKSNKMLK